MFVFFIWVLFGVMVESYDIHLPLHDPKGPETTSVMGEHRVSVSPYKKVLTIVYELISVLEFGYGYFAWFYPWE